jgi:membrane-associated protease RseP (regulator of RpoE activity)
LAVALPILIVGLSLSKVSTLPSQVPANCGLVLEGNSLLYLGLKYVVTGEWLPRPADFGAAGPGLYWLRYFFSGLPVPLGGQDVSLHPMAWAAWAGLMVTALNLIPAGQLDGGHALYVLLGDRASRAWPFLVVALAALGLVWPGWWLWAALIFFLGRVFAQPLDDITPLDTRRKALAVAAIIIFTLVFTPVPLRSLTGA